MTIAVVDFTLVVPLGRLDACWPGGIEAFRSEWGEEALRTDGHLAAAEFRGEEEAVAWLREHLVPLGLVHLESGRCVDVAIVDASCGLLAPCDWLHFEPAGTFGRATQVGAPMTAPRGPPGWDPERPPLGRTPASELPRRCHYQSMQTGWGGLFDEVTGEGMALPLAGPFDWNAFFRDRLALLKERADSQRKLLGEAAPTREKGAALLAISGEAHQIACSAEPFALEGLRLAGLTARLAGDYRRAPRLWWSMLALAPGDEEARRELAACFGRGSDLGEDFRRARSAVQSAPGDAESRRDLAWLLFMMGRIDQAGEWVRRTLAIAPEDRAAKTIQDLIAERQAAGPW